MSKNRSDSYGEAQKGVLRMARVNCNYNRGNTSLKKRGIVWGTIFMKMANYADMAK